MATTHGNDGKVAIGSNVVAEITSWSLTQGIAVADDTAMGDTDDTHKTGTKNWTANVSCWWDDTDTNGQEAMTIGASVTLHLYPEGNATGDDDYNGTATVTQIQSAGDRAGIVTRQFTCQGNGALTIGTVA